MTTSTKEIIDWLERQSKMAIKEKCPKAAGQLDAIAQHLRELESQVTELELQLLTERGAKAWKDVPDATAFVEELRGNKEST